MSVDTSSFGTFWKDLPDQTTPLNAFTLNAREAAIAEVYDATLGFSQDAQAAAEAATAPTDAQVAALMTDPDSSTYNAARSLIGGSFNKRALSLSRLPVNGSGILSYNGGGHIQDNVATFNGKQYAVWWGADSKAYIGQKTLPDGSWATLCLSDLVGNPFGTVAIDAHNNLSVSVDDTGIIHVFGNQHNSTLKYMKSSAPESIASFAVASMVGSNETSMTYPTPVVGADGTLFFWYREGISGAGDYYLNRYSTATGTWSRVGKIFDGVSTSESAYINHITTGPDGAFHLFFTWRATGYADTNNDFCYAKVMPSGEAYKSSGAAQTVPITHSNCEIVIDTAASGSGIINQQGSGVDSEGRPHAATWLYDGSGFTQIQHVWHDGVSWHNDTVTGLDYRIDLNVSVFQPYMSRAQVICPAQGGTYILYRCGYGGKGNVLRMIDVTPGRELIEFPICNIDLGDWEPCFDTSALKQRNELSMLLIPLAANYTNSVSQPWNNANNWNNQVVLHQVIDLYQIDSFRSGSTNLPEIRSIADRSGPSAGTTITATSAADLSHGPIPHWSDDTETLFVKWTGRLTAAASTTTTVEVRLAKEKPNSTGSGQTASASVTALSNEYVHTPWVNIAMGAKDDRGFVVLYGYKTGSGAASMSTAILKVGRLVGLTS